MTNLIGKWKIAEMMSFNEEKGCVEWAKTEDLLARDPTDKDMNLIGRMQIVFAEDGTITLLTPIPEGASQEEVDAAVKSGQITLKDGMMLMGENHWKIEDGKNMADTGLEGEVMGEKVGPWEELKEVGDGMLQMTMYHISRIE